MRKLCILFMLSLFGLVSFGQESFLFRNTLDDTANVNINYELASSHFLGEKIARKMLLLKETYTYIEKGTPMSPGDKVIVRKPIIYYDIRKLNKYYKKELKKGNIEEAAAKEQMADILDKCIVIFDQDTDQFEEYLKGLKHPEDIVAAFDKIVLE